MRTFIINLPKDAKRRAFMQNQLARSLLDYEFIEAIDAKSLSVDELHQLVYKYDEANFLLGEIGCALSHKKIYQKMVDEHIDYAFILEDDALFPSDAADMAKICITLGNMVNFDDPSKPNAYLLSNTYFSYFVKEKHLHTNVYEEFSSLASHTYLINLAGAKSLVKFHTPLFDSTILVAGKPRDNYQARLDFREAVYENDSLYDEQHKIGPNKYSIDEVQKL